MKLSDYPTPQVDELWQKTGTMSKAQEPIWDLATQLEQKLAKCRNVMDGIADGFEALSRFNRTSTTIREILNETK